MERFQIDGMFSMGNHHETDTRDCPAHRCWMESQGGSPIKALQDHLSSRRPGLYLRRPSCFQVFQAKLFRSLDKSGPDPAAFRDLRSATDLALRTTKTTAQAIGRSMASLVVLERHLWLNLTEIKDAERAFLDSPVSIFAEAQKSSQAMQHFLPKRSSSASGRPKKASTPQPAKPTPPESHPRPADETHRRPQPFPDRQGPLPKIVLDPEPRKHY